LYLRTSSACASSSRLRTFIVDFISSWQIICSTPDFYRLCVGVTSRVGEH
jgi:hypothetical protein